MTQAKLTIGELKPDTPLLQSLETASAAGEVNQGHRTNRLLGTPGNPQSLPTNPIQVTFVSAGLDPS